MMSSSSSSSQSSQSSLSYGPNESCGSRLSGLSMMETREEKEHTNESEILDFINEISDECEKVLNSYYCSESEYRYVSTIPRILKFYKKCKTMFVNILTSHCSAILDPSTKHKYGIANSILRRSKPDPTGKGPWVHDDNDLVGDRILRGYEYIIKSSQSALGTPTLSEIYLHKKHSMLVANCFQDFLLQPEGKLKYLLDFPPKEFKSKGFASPEEANEFISLMGLFEKMLLTEIVKILLHFDQAIIVGKEKAKNIFKTIMGIYEDPRLSDDEKYIAMSHFVSDM